MQQFLYIFGYATPLQRKHNKAYGRDDENSNGFFIVAENKESAVAWGERVADAYMQLLYNDPGVSLKGLGYGGWIDEEPDDIQKCREDATPVISIGTYPELSSILEKRYGQESWWRERFEKQSGEK